MAKKPRIIKLIDDEWTRIIAVLIYKLKKDKGTMIKQAEFEECAAMFRRDTPVISIRIHGRSGDESLVLRLIPSKDADEDELPTDELPFAPDLKTTDIQTISKLVDKNNPDQEVLEITTLDGRKIKLKGDAAKQMQEQLKRS
jgi:hypothetical protein